MRQIGAVAEALITVIAGESIHPFEVAKGSPRKRDHAAEPIARKYPHSMQVESIISILGKPVSLSAERSLRPVLRRDRRAARDPGREAARPPLAFGRVVPIVSEA